MLDHYLPGRGHALPLLPNPVTFTALPSAFLVIRLTTAEKASDPYSTEPGPLIISIL